MANIYGPILPLQLDSRNTDALVRAIQTRIFLESEGKLNDFTPASPLAAISEGQAFAQAELLYYLNNLPEAFSLQWLRQLGIQRRIGSRALVDVTFFKVPGYQRVVIIPAGTKLYSNSRLAFVTLSEVRIDESTQLVTVACQSEKWGSSYNVGAGEINKIERNFIGLESLSNDEPAVGGSDLESVDQMKIRAFEVLSRRNLTTALDFENEVQTLAPEASIIKVLTYEERNQLASSLSGNIVVCVGDSDGNELSQSSLSYLINSMKSRLTIGTNISFLPPTVVPLDIVVEIFYDPLELSGSIDLYANQIYSSLNTYFDPTTLGLGVSIDYQTVARLLYNFDFIKSINNLDIKSMVLDPASIEGPCAGFSGTESTDGSKCLYNYSEVIDSSTQNSTLSSPVLTYKLYRTEIVFTSVNDFSALRFLFDNLYTP
jgi:hypothetical protein